MYHLFSIRGALPYFAVLFFNAFVDLGHKITMQNTIFKLYDGTEQVVLTAIVNGLILLPFIVCFVGAGITTDKFAKNKIMQFSAWAAVLITSFIALFYFLGWFWLAFGMTFLLAVQSAFYSPAKFSYIRQLFGKDQLAQANGLVQAITIAGILLGTFAFSILFESLYVTSVSSPDQALEHLTPIGLILVAISILELFMAYKLPNLDTKLDQTSYAVSDYFSASSATKTIKPIRKSEIIFLSIIGTAIFWSVGQVMLAAFPAFAKEALLITNTIAIQGVIAASGIGIAIGASLAGRISRGYIETGLIPVGALGIALGLSLVTHLDSIYAHALNYLFIGTMGGIFIVPLNALIQFHAKEDEIGKILAGKNLIQNMSMLTFLALIVAFALTGLKSQHLLYLIALVAAVGGIYTIIKLPQSLVRIFVTFLFASRYRVRVQNIKHIPEEGGVLLLGNHISWIDWAVIQIASPRPVHFVMTKDIYELWYLRWFFDLFGVIPIQSGPTSRESLNSVADLLNDGKVVCLFPEGTLTKTGHLAEFRKGYERACELANDDVKIVPFYIRGLWGSQFSRSSEELKKTPKGLFREIIVAFGEPLQKDTKADTLKRRVFDISVHSWQEYVQTLPSLAKSWVDTVKRIGNKLSIVDTQGVKLTGFRALSAALAFSRRIAWNSKDKNIGILLPTSAGAVLTNMACLLAGKTLVNLNFSASISALKSAVHQADIKSIYTSKKFIAKLNSKGIDVSAILDTTKVIYVEELKENISTFEMLITLIGVKVLPAFILKQVFCKNINPQQTAAILFSSGSEGDPKGIKLSHQNINANLKQISDVLNMQSDDVILASLPLFHAFGLTVTQFMPLIEGIPLVCHPDPTDAVNIAKASAKYKATIMFGTSTFLRLFNKNKKVHPLMFTSLRLVVAGAEKLNPEVRKAFQMKFNKPVYEGYGATETTPVASVNLPDCLDVSYWKLQLGNKQGTVGMPLPGTSIKIVDPETWQELPSNQDGMILIGGLQVMQEYLNNPEKTQEVIREENGIRWYVTGDKGHLDDDGFLTIIDRYSRFAKLGGEMVSLSMVEAQIIHEIASEDFEICAINIQDERKGEKIVALVNQEIDKSKLSKTLLAQGHNALSIPDEFILVESIPKLGSGKTNFSEAKKLAIN